MNLRELYSAVMCDALELEFDALYTYERALRDGGQFPRYRRGYGSGTPAKPQNVARLLEAILGSPKTTGCGRLAELVGSLPVIYAVKCEITGESCFHWALAALLGSPGAAADIEYVEVDQGRLQAIISKHVDLADRSEIKSRFANLFDPPSPPLRQVRILTGDALRRIVAAMQGES
jgi:hypothetical protein